ncbi:MAG: HAD hydrolase-like protein [Sulfolobales archaeon]
MPRVLFLDLDLTLIDTLRGMYMAFISILSSLNREIPRLSIESFVKEYYDNDLDSVLRLNSFEERWRFWNNVWRRYALDPTLYGQPYRCVEDVVNSLRGRYYIVITTGREIDSRCVRRELEKIGLENLFHEIYSVGDLGLYKRKLDLYRHLVGRFERLGFKPGELFVISDSYKDLLNAEKIGLRGIGYVPEDIVYVKDYFDKIGVKYIYTWCEVRDLERFINDQ